MESCLGDQALVLLHSGEGSESERAHLESCLSCARRYRELSSQLGTIVTALRQPPPRVVARHRWPHPALGWSLAAAAIVLAFVCGRITAFGVNSQEAASFESPSEPDSADPGDPSIQWLEANAAGTAAPISYGLYVDDLLAQDEPDQNPVVPEGNGEADSDGM